MSLDDGTSKMSKSDANDGSRINLLDPPDVIKRKIKKYGGKDATEKRDEIEKCVSWISALSSLRFSLLDQWNMK